MNSNLIKQLKEFSEARNTTVLTYEGLKSEIKLNIPADEEKIKDVQTMLKIQLPEDIITFLNISNGGVFFQIEDFAGYQLFDCDELIRHNNYQKRNYSDDWDSKIIILGLCIGDGDFIGLRIIDEQNYEIVDCYLDELPKDWKGFSNSFGSFLEKLLQESGKKYWVS